MLQAGCWISISVDWLPFDFLILINKLTFLVDNELRKHKFL